MTDEEYVRSAWIESHKSFCLRVYEAARTGRPCRTEERDEELT
jgi:hypothetical protein